MERLMDTSAKADAAKEEIENPSARKTIKQIASLIQRKSLDQKEQVQKIMPILILLISASLEKLVKRLIWYLEHEKEHGHTRGGKK